MKAEYLQAAESQLEWLRWTSSDTGRAFFDEDATRYAMYLRPLRQGDLIYVAPDFCALLEAAARDLPDTVIPEHLVPVESAFVLLDRPIELPALNDGHAGGSLMAVGWVSFEDQGLAIAGYTQTAEPAAEVPYMPTLTVRLPYGTSIATYLKDMGASPEQEPTFGLALRIVGSLLLMMGDKLLARESVALGRAQRRRAERLGRPNFDQIQVVTYRRYGNPGAASTATTLKTWNSRWVVRGHWRNQYYPSAGEHRPKWIVAYIKGPEGLPVKEQKHILAVVR